MIDLRISNKNQGKLRFKIRKSHLEFGQSFPTLKSQFNKEVYLEWQIGYEAYEKDILNGRKITSLDQKSFSFLGANNKQKYPYELSEYLYQFVKKHLSYWNQVKQIQSEIENYHEFLSSKPKVDLQKEITFNSLDFDSAVTKLPTYYYSNKDSTYVEIIIQKQQYASGFQPMVYFCIPLLCFSNGKEMIGHSSKEKQIELIYHFKFENVLNLFRVFAMVSQIHHDDTKKILKVLLKER